MIYGFYEIKGFLGNIPNSPNPIGEISSVALTYSKTIKEYPTANGVLHVFDVGTLTSGQSTNLNSSCSNVAALLNGIPGYNSTPGTLLLDIETALTNAATNVTIGASILNPIDSTNYPAWVSFTITENSQSYTFMIWLSNNDFLNNYPLGNIQLIFPISNLADLYNNFTTSKATVNALSLTDFVNLGSNISGVITNTTSFTVLVQETTDSTQTFQFPVYVAYNGGPIYCNHNNYFQAFVNAVLASSTLTLSQWLAAIPSLVPVNTFLIVVNWQNTAVSNGSLANPICSPTIPVVDASPLASTYFPDYTLGQVSGFLDYTCAMYKSVGLYILPLLGNADGRLTWSAKFPDYFLVGLTDVNLGQMSVLTQTMASTLNSLIAFAETYVTGVTLPSGVSVLTRGNKTYVCQTVNSVQMCVLTRASVV